MLAIVFQPWSADVRCLQKQLTNLFVQRDLLITLIAGPFRIPPAPMSCDQASMAGFFFFSSSCPPRGSWRTLHAACMNDWSVSGSRGVLAAADTSMSHSAARQLLVLQAQRDNAAGKWVSWLRHKPTNLASPLSWPSTQNYHPNSCTQMADQCNLGRARLTRSRCVRLSLVLH